MADLSALPEGYRRVTYASLGSTNREALERARAGDAGRLWVTAAEQTAGRGRRGRDWAGGRGNLAASLLLVDPASPEIAATISFVAAIALHHAVVAVAGPPLAERLALKWPNDLLLDRRKVAGILVEGERTAHGTFAVVAGMGVNCTSHPEIDGPMEATDFGARGFPIDSEFLFGALAASMAQEIARWDRGRGFSAIRDAWLKRAAGVGDEIRVNLENRSVIGRFQDIDRDGRLVLQRADGVRETFSAGDIFFPVVV